MNINENPLVLLGARAPAREKIFQSVKKFQTKIWRIHLDIICVHVKFRRKLIYCMACVKNIKGCLVKNNF